MEEKYNKIRDMFLTRQEIYRDRGLDVYTSIQLAAQDTKLEFNITREELNSILNNNVLDEAQKDYEEWYEKRKNEVCTRLLTIKENCPDDTYSKWLLDAINFIQEEKR